MEGTSRVAKYVEEARTSPTAQGAVIDRFSVPLEEYLHFQLVWLAEKFGRSQSQVASDFLRICIEEAMQQFRLSREDAQGGLFLGDDDQHLHGDEAYWYFHQKLESELVRGYSEWKKGGKKGPRGREAAGDEVQRPMIVRVSEDEAKDAVS